MIRSAQTADVLAISRLYHRIWHETHGPKTPIAERQKRDECAFIARISALMPNIVVADGPAA